MGKWYVSTPWYYMYTYMLHGKVHIQHTCICLRGYIIVLHAIIIIVLIIQMII